MKMFKTLREENELIMKLKGFCPGNKIPRGILMQGPEALKTGKNFLIRILLLFIFIYLIRILIGIFFFIFILFYFYLAYERYKNAKQLDSVNEKRTNMYNK